MPCLNWPEISLYFSQVNGQCFGSIVRRSSTATVTDCNINDTGAPNNDWTTVDGECGYSWSITREKEHSLFSCKGKQRLVQLLNWLIDYRCHRRSIFQDQTPVAVCSSSSSRSCMTMHISSSSRSCMTMHISSSSRSCMTMHITYMELCQMCKRAYFPYTMQR